MLKNIEIKLNPYLGCSKNLMEFFVIIGYEERILNELGSEILEKQDILELTIISNAISDLAFKIFDPDNIIKQIYPDKPKIIKSEIPPKSSSVVFSSCFDSLDGQKKIFYSCFALRFYEKYKDKNNIEYFVPKAFLILSQYPYFTTFYKICQIIVNKNQDKKEDNIPIEILVHCYVNYIPSPIRKNIIFKDFNKKIIIPRLTGYPYVDFDLCKIFNCIPLKEFIKIYLLIFLELDLLIFSPDLEKLNIFMFILYILNYPLTDSNYFWHIKSISKDQIKLGNNTLNTSFIGINSEYSPNLDFSNFKSLNFVIDIENKKKQLINIIKTNKESEEINKLLKYVFNILKKKKVNSDFLGNLILTLKEKIKSIKVQYNQYNYRMKNSTTNSFFSVSKFILETNRKIQEMFYDFLLDILVVLNKDFELDPSLKMPIKLKNQNKKYCEEEQIFLKYCRNTIKYNTYFDLFIKRFTSAEELKVSLLFSDEYVNLKMKDINKKIPKNINYFAIMDNLYSNNKENYEINYNNLYEEFKKLNERHLITKFQKEKKDQLFSFDKKLIKLFMFHKKNKESYKSLKEKEEVNVEVINKMNIALTIRNYFNRKLTDEYYIRSSFIYIFALSFPLFSFQNSLFFLCEVLDGLAKTIYFQRYYLYILLKSFVQYYLVNLENENFPDLTFKNVQEYSQLIKASLINNQIAPNEEMFLFFKYFTSNQIIKNDDNHKKDIKNNFVFHIDKEKEENILKNIENNIDIIKNVIETKEQKLIFTYNDIKVESNFLKEEELYIGIDTIHDDYFTRFNCDIMKLNIETIIEIIINIINFLVNKKYDVGKKERRKSIKKVEIIEDKKMVYFLIYLVIILKDLENCIKEYKKKNNIEDIEEDKKDNKEKNGNNKKNINNNKNNNTIINIEQNKNNIFNENRSFGRFNSLIDDYQIDVGSINDDNLEIPKSYSFFDDYIDMDNIKKKLKNNNKTEK